MALAKCADCGTLYRTATDRPGGRCWCGGELPSDLPPSPPLCSPVDVGAATKQVEVNCYPCNGEGVDRFGKWCPVCKGSGRLMQTVPASKDGPIW